MVGARPGPSRKSRNRHKADKPVSPNLERLCRVNPWGGSRGPAGSAKLTNNRNDCMQRKHLIRLLLGVGMIAATGPLARAQSADALIDKLVEKGILTVKEANDLREEADKDFSKAYSVKSGMPEWVTSLKINGDLRGRFEGFYADNPAFVDRSRWRYRLRFGATANLMDNFEVGLRLGSGDLDNASSLVSGSDPISNNQTLQNNASKKGIFLDLAYGKWTPIHTPELTGTFIGGKMENPFQFSDMLFDNDYTPEGLAQQFGYNLSSRHTLRLNLGEFVLDELSGDVDDPYLFGGQLRLESVWNPRITTSAGIGFLTILNEELLASSAVPDINAGNLRNTRVTTNSDGSKTVALTSPQRGYDTLVADAALTYTLDAFPLYTGAFPIKVFGEYLHNSAAGDRDQGYQVGVTFGKSGKRRTWELTYRYKVLEGDAWWEELTDSDFGAYYANSPASTLPQARNSKSGYWAGTNVRGHVLKAAYSPVDPLTLSVTWFATDLIEEYKAGTDSQMNRIQVDAALKF